MLGIKSWQVDPWKTEGVKIPQQIRGSANCAVYACAYVDALAREVPHPWIFDGAKIREQMVEEMVRGELFPKSIGFLQVSPYSYS